MSEVKKKYKKMQACSVRGCINSRRRTMTYHLPGNEVMLHQFPTNRYKCLQWANAIGQPHILQTKRKRICSLHFAEHYIVMCKNSEKKKRLLPDAIPTIFNVDPRALDPPKNHSSARKRSRSKSPRNSGLGNVNNSEYVIEIGEVISVSTTPKSKQINSGVMKKKNSGIDDNETDDRNNSYDLIQGIGSDYDYNSDDYSDDNRNTKYGSGSIMVEYTSEPNVSYISTSGKRSNPLHSLARHHSPNYRHDPRGTDYAPPHRYPKHYRPKTILTPARGIVKKKKIKRNVRFEDPAQASLRELRDEQNRQIQFSLMSFAPVEIDQSASFTSPAGNTILHSPRNDGSPEKTLSQDGTEARRTVDPAIAADVYLQEIQVLNKKFKELKEKTQELKKKVVCTNNIKKQREKRLLELSTTVNQLWKKKTLPPLNIKDKNIRVIIS